MHVLQPKRHLLWHLLDDLDYFGNPSGYATWYDEAMNFFAEQNYFDKLIYLVIFGVRP